MDNGFFRALSRLADIMILNIVFLICCIPIVTIGPALTGMYYVTLKMAVNEEGYIVRGFLKSFRQNFRQALTIWLLMLAIGVVLVLDLIILRSAAGTPYTVMRIIIMATSLVYLMVMIYVFPTLAQFENSIKNTLRNSLLMSIIDFPRTFVMLVVTIGPVVLTLYNGYTLWFGLLIWIMAGFALVAYVNSKFLTKVYKKYIPAEEPESGSGEELPAEEPQDQAENGLPRRELQELQDQTESGLPEEEPQDQAEEAGQDRT